MMIISSSPNKNGTTAQLVEKIIEQLPASIPCRVFDAYEMNVQPCIDCGRCKKNIGCVHHDLDEFFKTYEEADFVIFAAPVYNMSFPAPMKAIIDRFQMYYNYRFSLGMRPPVSKPKACGLVLSSGKDDEVSYKYMTLMIKRMLTVANGKLIAGIAARDRDRMISLPDSFAIKNFVLKLLYASK